MYGRKKRLLVVGGHCVLYYSDLILDVEKVYLFTTQATYLQQNVQNPNMWNWISVQCPQLILIWCPVMIKSKPLRDEINQWTSRTI